MTGPRPEILIRIVRKSKKGLNASKEKRATKISPTILMIS
jgi:hypothetical protein